MVRRALLRRLSAVFLDLHHSLASCSGESISLPRNSYATNMRRMTDAH
jgi:hypothetical protein